MLLMPGPHRFQQAGDGSAAPLVEGPTGIGRQVGRHDPQYPPACSEELAAGIPDARLVWFESGGHYPFTGEPEKFWAAVDGFLSP